MKTLHITGGNTGRSGWENPPEPAYFLRSTESRELSAACPQFFPDDAAQEHTPFEESGTSETVPNGHAQCVFRHGEQLMRRMTAPLHVLSAGFQYFESAYMLSVREKKLYSTMQKELYNLGNMVFFLRLAFDGEMVFCAADSAELLNAELSEMTKTFRAAKISVDTRINRAPKIVCSPEFFRQCIKNVLHNIHDFALRPSTLLIENRIRIKSGRSVLAVSFTHPVSNEHVVNTRNACSLFSSSDASRPGIGLALCRAAMRAMGGDVSLDVLPGQAICTTLSLPA